MKRHSYRLGAVRREWLMVFNGIKIAMQWKRISFILGKICRSQTIASVVMLA
jgi:hypothetical protein